MEVVVQGAQRWPKSSPLGPVIANGLFSWIPTNYPKPALGCGLKALPHALGAKVTPFTTSPEPEWASWRMELCPNAVYTDRAGPRELNPG